ncbi:response regulator transcription factor [Zemynaea arenosa]|nr:response regulator transcription factor [Massilia arenosa]
MSTPQNSYPKPMSHNANAAPCILVVEDDEHIAQVLKFMLERQGYQATLCADGATARSHIASQPAAALVLLDVMLPHVDGFELVGLIRRNEDWRDTPIIMLTAKNMETDIVRALDAGASDYIAKPFQPNELLARIRRHVRPR